MSPSRRLALLTLTAAAVPALASCGGGATDVAADPATGTTTSSSSPTPEPPTAEEAATLEAVKSDVRIAAVVEESYYLDEHVFTDRPAVLAAGGLRLPRTHSLVVTLVEGNYELCAVDDATGIWAFYDAAKGGLLGAGYADARCEATDPVP